MAAFLDAGYVLAGAHDLLGGTVSRSAFDCDYEELLPALRTAIEEHSGGSLTFLRSYWYDGARDGIPTADHRRVGGLAYVKVRLGRLNRRGQQKGVDGLIYRDLTALARTGAIERAYLFTGDEDLRESVVAAQDLGVQIVLIAFAPTAQTGRSAALVQEVDEVIVFERAFWEPHFKPNVPAAPSAQPPTQEQIRESAEAFVEEWASGATIEEMRQLLDQAPKVPKEIDVQLVIHAEKTLGSLREQGPTKGALRKAFWKELKVARRAQSSSGTVAEEES